MISPLYTQEVKVSDSLTTQSYTVLDSLYYSQEYTAKGRSYISAYLQKAKSESNVKEIIRGYHFFADFYDNDYENGTIYIDSAITLAHETGFKNRSYPAALYGKKGYIERIKGNFKEALDYYLKKLEIGDFEPNSTQMTYLNHNIALLKRDNGDFDGAKSIFKKNLAFERNYLKDNPNDDKGYFEASILSLSELIKTYRLNNEIDSAKILTNQGLKIGLHTDFGHLLVLHDGILDCHNKNYESSIAKITSVLPKVSDVSEREIFEIQELIEAYLYLGKSYEALGNDTQKLLYYERIDSLTTTSNYLIPETKLAYLGLVNHYKQLGDNKRQLAYLDKLIMVDSILDINYKYINDRLETDYDIPNLLVDKEKLIVSLKNENVEAAKTRLIISIFLGISFLGFLFFFVKQQHYKQRFKSLLNEKTATQKKDSIAGTKQKQRLDISEDTINHIAKCLDQFENEGKYLKMHLTLDKMAKSFKTNSKYLSLLLNQTKGKSVSQYVNDLRIDYVVDKLKNDLRFRKFTIKAIANEIGFSTDRAFSKAFYKKTGIYPSYFIKALEKQN